MRLLRVPLAKLRDVAWLFLLLDGRINSTASMIPFQLQGFSNPGEGKAPAEPPGAACPSRQKA
jgi:hypothetical protein